MEIYIEPARYGNQKSKITIAISSDVNELVQKLEAAFPAAQIVFDESPLGQGLEDRRRLRA